MKVALKMILLPMVAFLAACSSAFDSVLFRLVHHPQEPGPRPYTVREAEFVNARDGIRLAGELTYPASGEPFPALVLVSGHSGGEPPADRDNYITGHKYFLVISHLLTLRGYAVLRYDNRGVGKSSGDYADASDNEFASDAAAALKWLREDSGIQLASSGFLGHSQGGIKSLLAAEIEKPDFIVSLAGMGIETTAEAIIRQNQEISKATGVKQAITDQQTKEMTDIFEILRKSRDREQAQLLIQQYARDAGVTDETHIRKLVTEFGSAWWFTESHRDVQALIESYDGPVLALFGSKDLLVSASKNEAPTRNLLRHPRAKSHTFENLNHLFQISKKGTGPEEYWEIPTTIEEKVIDEIDVWIRSISLHSESRT